jgi:hypothetical protein
VRYAERRKAGPTACRLSGDARHSTATLTPCVPRFTNRRKPRPNKPRAGTTTRVYSSFQIRRTPFRCLAALASSIENRKRGVGTPERVFQQRDAFPEFGGQRAFATKQVRPLFVSRSRISRSRSIRSHRFQWTTSRSSVSGAGLSSVMRRNASRIRSNVARSST